MKKFLLTLILMLPVYSYATPISISGFGQADGLWEVTLLGPTTYSADLAELRSQIWWGELLLAIEFSELVNTALGLSNDTGPTLQFGPHFAFSPTNTRAWDFNDNRSEGWTYSANSELVFAVAERVPEPGVVGLLSLGLLGLGISRRRKLDNLRSQ